MEANKFELCKLNVKPKSVITRTFTDITITFSLNFDIEKDSTLIFRFRGGRNNKNDWYYLQNYNPNMKGYVKLTLSSPAKLLPLLLTGKDLMIKYLICEDKGIKKGTRFIFNVYKTLVQSLSEINKKIEILVETPDKELKLLDNSPTINVISEKYDHITLICPSIVKVNEKFQLLGRIEDKFKNLVKDFSGQIQLYKSSNFIKKEFFAEVRSIEFNKGIFRKSDLTFSKSGNYIIEASYDETFFQSNPIICKDPQSQRRLYWGYIHGHTNKSDGMSNLEDYFKNLIDAGLDFGTTTEHDHIWETSDEDFKEIKETVEKYHKEGLFVSFFGYEWGYWYTGGYGDICIYFYNNNHPILRSDLNKFNSTKKLIKNLKLYEDEVLMIAHHTSLRPGFRNWDYFDNSLEKLVEIYSTWGSQEYSNREGNPLPPRYKFFGYGKHAKKRGPILEKKGSFVQDALKRGFKLGFTAGGDDHFGTYPSGSIDPDNGIYPSGIMAVWAENLTKKSIWDALLNRRCYGTTGPRVIIEFYLEDYCMGQIIDLNKSFYLHNNRSIRIKAISPIIIQRIELIRNNFILKKKTVNSKSIDLIYYDKEPFDKIAFEHVNHNEKMIFYYTRFFLDNESMAWASPIWIVKN